MGNQTDPIHQMLMDVPLTTNEVIEETEETEEIEEFEEIDEVEYEEEPDDDVDKEEYERPAVWKECF